MALDVLIPQVPIPLPAATLVSWEERGTCVSLCPKGNVHSLLMLSRNRIEICYLAAIALAHKESTNLNQRARSFVHCKDHCIKTKNTSNHFSYKTLRMQQHLLFTQRQSWSFTNGILCNCGKGCPLKNVSCSLESSSISKHLVKSILFPLSW